MFDRDRFVHIVLQIDTNRINAKSGLPNMNRLEAWHVAGVILMHMSRVAHQEARLGSDAHRSRKASSYIYSLTEISTEDEWTEFQTIGQVLFPQGVATQNERNDVEIVFNAKKYGAILVTNDGGSKRQPGGILGNREALARLGIRVMTDAEAVSYVREKIAHRDARMRRRAQLNGTTLPVWVGKD